MKLKLSCAFKNKHNTYDGMGYAVNISGVKFFDKKDDLAFGIGSKFDYAMASYFRQLKNISSIEFGKIEPKDLIRGTWKD